MKGVMKGQELFLISNTMGEIGPFEVRNDYDRYNMPFDDLLETRAELLISDFSRIGLSTLREILDFESNDPDIDTLRLTLKNMV